MGAAAIQHNLHTAEPEVFDLLGSTCASLTTRADVGADEDTPPCARPAARRDALELVFLGTGAAIPSKYRNVTGVRWIHAGLHARCQCLHVVHHQSPTASAGKVG